MTLGDGILWSTVLVLFAAAIYQISVRHKWKLVGKIIGILMLVGAVVGGGVWGWNAYNDRPHIVREFDNVRLGMKPVDVMIGKGKAAEELDLSKPESKEKLRAAWVYRSDSYGPALFVIFEGSTRDNMAVTRICKRDGYHTLLGIDTYTSEKGVVRKLGEPSHVRINDDQLSKWLSYERWKVAYNIEAGKVAITCVTEEPFLRVQEDSPTDEAIGDP